MLGEEAFGPRLVSVCSLKLFKWVIGLLKHVISETSNTTKRQLSLLSIIGGSTTILP